MTTPPMGNPLHPRVTMNLAMILAIPDRVLMVIGDEKKTVLQQAKNSQDLPITRLLAHQGTNHLKRFDLKMAPLHPIVEETIANIKKRSQKSRSNYLERVARMEQDPDSNRGMVGCSNLAHVAAGALDDQADFWKVISRILGSSPPIMICYQRINRLRNSRRS